MRRAVVAMVAAVALLLAGCSEIPTSGTVQPGTTEAPNGTRLVYVPNPPASGASQQEIVSGFLTAASGGGAFTVAKQYLTGDFAKRWVPTTRVLVQDSQATLGGTGADIRAMVPVSATVDSAGVYTPASGSKPLTFHLVQDRGQWRIDAAPNGIVLTQTVFQQTYVQRQLQFFDVGWNRLVPDRRWFPASQTDGSSGPDVAATVAALINGPAGPLSGRGVTSNALQGAKLVGVSPAGAGATTVTLSVDGPTPSTTTTTRMQQQIVQSIGSAPSAIRLVVNSLVVPQARAITDQLTLEAYVLAGGRFGTLSASGTFTADRTLGARIAATKPRSITVSLRQKLAVVRTGSGDVAIVTAAGPKVVDTRGGLLLATLDQQGWAYSVPSDSPSGLRVSNGKRSYELGVDLGTGTVTAIQASPDGSRLLVLLDGPSGPHADVVGIERDATGAPTGLTSDQYSVDLGGLVGTAGDATWVDDADVAVLVTGSDSDQIVTQQLGGITVALAPFANVTSIVGTSGTDDLRIRVAAGGLYVWNDPNWQQQGGSAVDVGVLAVQR